MRGRRRPERPQRGSARVSGAAARRIRCRQPQGLSSSVTRPPRYFLMRRRHQKRRRARLITGGSRRHRRRRGSIIGCTFAVRYASGTQMSSEAEIVTQDASRPGEISRAELQSRLRVGTLKLVDVLPNESYAMGHIPGAINLPSESIATRAPELLPDRQAEIVVYCGKFT
jgi:Rhodanese-like domain